MRIAIRAVSGVALALVVVGIAQAVRAISSPVGCPGAFFGCPQNGEEASYTAVLWADALAAIAGVLALLVRPRVGDARWRAVTLATFLAPLIVFPLPIGMVVSIFTSTVWPGYGVFVYVPFPLLVSVALLAFAQRWPVGTPLAHPPAA